MHDAHVSQHTLTAHPNLTLLTPLALTLLTPLECTHPIAKVKTVELGLQPATLLPADTHDRGE